MKSFSSEYRIAKPYPYGNVKYSEPIAYRNITEYCQMTVKFLSRISVIESGIYYHDLFVTRIGYRSLASSDRRKCGVKAYAGSTQMRDRRKCGIDANAGTINICMHICICIHLTIL